MDICTRFYFIKFTHFEYNQLKELNKPYISENKKLKKENEQLLVQLKQFIEKNNIQLYICFKCGNLLSKKNEKSKSTCQYDNNCFSISWFYCKLCKIHFCSYCIHYPRDLKCVNKQTLNSKDNVKNSNEKLFCNLCGKYNNKNDSYYSNKCLDLILCQMCQAEVEQTKMVQYKCACGYFLFWRRGLLKICDKCKKFSNCFWMCFFCKKFYCLSCYKTYENKCGLMHELKEICLDNLEFDSKMHVKDLFINKILLMRFNCDVCKNQFCSRYFYCSRCNFIKCCKCNC